MVDQIYGMIQQILQKLIVISCNDNNDCGDDYICNSSSGFKCCTKKDEPLIVCNPNATPPETCPDGTSCPKCNSNTCCCPPIK